MAVQRHGAKHEFVVLLQRTRFHAPLKRGAEHRGVKARGGCGVNRLFARSAYMITAYAFDGACVTFAQRTLDLTLKARTNAEEGINRARLTRR